ncbi:MAG: rhamnulokinase [Clostridiales bacterium]|nr:rhamnulokinase [Clostridiales bacterium]
MKTYLAIDIGASSGRHIVAWLEKGKIETREVYRFPNDAIMKNGHLCWDIEALETHVVLGLKAAKEQGWQPACIGIDTWGVDFVFLDKEGKRLGDAVAYRDSRTDGMDAELEKVMPFRCHFGLCGIAKQPFNTVYQMMAVVKEHPEYAVEAADFLMMPEYLSYILTGKKAHEWTNCTTGALCNAESGTWSETIRAAAGIPDSWFGTPMVKPGTVLGALTERIAAKIGYQSVVILPATHDTGSAYMAVPARDDGAAFLSSGTWSLLGTELPAPITGEDALNAGFTNEGGFGGTIRFLKNIMGMWMLQRIHKEIGKAHTFAEMAEMARNSFYPAYIDAADNRFLAPESMLEEVKAALRDAGAPAPACLADILRAVTMGLAVCYAKSIREMSAITGKTFTSVNIVGGGSANIVLNQMTADITGLPVYAGPTEGTALGNLAAQMIADGAFADLAAFRAALPGSFEIKEYMPKSKGYTERNDQHDFL